MAKAKKGSKKGIAKIKCMQRYYRKHAPKKAVVTRGLIKRLKGKARKACKVGKK